MKIVVFPSAKSVQTGYQSVGKVPPIVYPVDQRSMFQVFKEYYFASTKTKMGRRGTKYS